MKKHPTYYWIGIIMILVAIGPICYLNGHDYIKTYPYNHSQLKPIDTMKQCTLKFPVSKSKEVAKFLAEHGIITNLSYMESDGFFDKTITAIICFPDDKEDKVKANLQKWIKE